MPPVRQSSLRSVVLGVLALAALAYLLLPALFPPQADEVIGIAPFRVRLWKRLL